MRAWLLVASFGCLAALHAQKNGGEAGRFDYYVLSLSWSPQHCAERPNDRVQCASSRTYGFVLHGLWPQYERGFPSSCASKEKLDAETARGMLDIMPSPRLVEHEWEKHGVCDGRSAAEYFRRSRLAFQTLKTPAKLEQPMESLTYRPSEFKALLLAANPAWKENQVAVLCSGRFLQEVRVCLDKNLRPRDCSSGVRDRCNVSEMIVRPVR